VAGCASAAAKPKKSNSKSSKTSKSSTRSKGAASRARRSGHPRQLTPTPERYKEIQQALADRGYYSGPVNGSWDAECVSALKSFQQDQNLDADGKLGALSIIALGLGPKRQLSGDLSAKPETADEP
jgi:peptidoglycan hydrolase-like protein with peptidoglycan-binding domain